MKRKKLQKLSAFFMKIDAISSQQKIQFPVRKKENLITFFSIKKLSPLFLMKNTLLLFPGFSFYILTRKFINSHCNSLYRFKPGYLSRIKTTGAVGSVLSFQTLIQGQPALREAKKCMVPTLVFTNGLKFFKSIRKEERTFKFSGKTNVHFLFLFYFILFYSS